MQRLDLNLSTQPFRNNTMIWAGYGLAVALLFAFAAWNGTTYFRHLILLDEKKSQLEDLAAQQADLEARERTAERERQRRELALENLTVQSLKANEVIEWKAFSWTELFNRLETTLPWNVYMSAVRPVFRAERGKEAASRAANFRSRPVSVEGHAKSLAALLDFERRLFASEYFDDPEPIRHARDERGELVFTMRFMYFPDGRPRRRVIDDVDAEATDVAQSVPAEEIAEPAVGARETSPRKGTAAGTAGDDSADSIGAAEPPTIRRASDKAQAAPGKADAQEVRP